MELPTELKRGPFTLQQVLPHGVTRRQLEGKGWRRLGHGIYAWAGLSLTPMLHCACCWSRAGCLALRRSDRSATEPVGCWHGVDLYYEDARLAIEFDGGIHREQLIDDNRRQNRLVNADVEILRFTAPDVQVSKGATLEQVKIARARRLRRVGLLGRGAA